MLTMPHPFEAFSQFLTQISVSVAQKDIDGVRTCVAKLQSQFPNSISFNDILLLNNYSDPLDVRLALFTGTINANCLEIFQYFNQELGINFTDIASNLLSLAILDSHDIAIFILQTNIEITNINLGILYGTALSTDNEQIQKHLWERLCSETSAEQHAQTQKGFDDKKEKVKNEINAVAKLLNDDIENLSRLATQIDEAVAASNPLWGDLLRKISLEAKKTYTLFQSNHKNPVIQKIQLEMLIFRFKELLSESDKKEDNLPQALKEILTKMIMLVNHSEREFRYQSYFTTIDLNDILIKEFKSLFENIKNENTANFINTWESLKTKPRYWEDLYDFYLLLFNTNGDTIPLAFIEDALNYSNFELYDYLVCQYPEISPEISALSLSVGAKRNHVSLVQDLLKNISFSEQILIFSHNTALAYGHDELASIIGDALEAPMAATLSRLRHELKEYAQNKVATQQKYALEKNTALLIKLNELKDTFKNKNEAQNLLQSIDELMSILESINQDMRIGNGLFISKVLLAQLLALRLSTIIYQDIEHALQVPLITDISQQLNMHSYISDIHSANPITDLSELPEGLQLELLRGASEDAIAPLTSEEFGLFHEIKKKYEQKFNLICKRIEKSETSLSSHDADIVSDTHSQTDATPKQREQSAPYTRLPCYPVLKDLEEFLKTQFSKDNLSEKYDPNLSIAELEKYHTHPFHTAWRYLFCKPNPWLFKGSKWAKNGASAIPDEDYERIAYFWLAVSDEESPCTQGFTLDKRKSFFVDMLASFGREYSKDTSSGDDPTCDLAVRKRQNQLLIGHPILDEVKELKPEYILQLIKQYFIAQNDSWKTLFNDLSTLSLKELNQLNDALTSWITNCGDVGRIDSLILNILKLDVPVLKTANNEFVAQLENEFGFERLTKIKVTYQAEKYDSYDDFIQKVGSNLLKFFSAEIYQHVNGLLCKREPQIKNSSAPLTTSFDNFRKMTSPSDHTYDTDDEIDQDVSLVVNKAKKSKANTQQ